MISIYTTAYLINKNRFPFIDSLRNYSDFLAEDDEIVIGTTQEGIEDGTLDVLHSYIEDNKLNRVKIVISDSITFSSNRFDGQIKDFALQNTRHPIKIQMDMDEIFVLSQRERWLRVISQFNYQSSLKAVFVPSIDLYKDERYIRKNTNLGVKWRIHKEGLKRGVWKGAELENGLFDTSKSDSGELLDMEDNLVHSSHVAPLNLLTSENAYKLEDYIYTLHLGHLNLDYRRNINENWWKDKWKDRMLKDENVETDLNKLQREEVIEHNLSLV